MTLIKMLPLGVQRCKNSKDATFLMDGGFSMQKFYEGSKKHICLITGNNRCSEIFKIVLVYFSCVEVAETQKKDAEVTV